MGALASNKPFIIHVIDIHQVWYGKIVPTWYQEDWLNGLFQMGVLPVTK